VFAFSLKDASRYSVYDISERLRVHGWQVPAYTMPPDATDVSVLRIVVREGFSKDMADMLLADIEKVVSELEATPPLQPKTPGGVFHHG
jgi:glutamate decarboxylase